MTERWTDIATRELLRLIGPSGGWGERPGGSPRAEPSALAGLSLLACHSEDSAVRAARRAGEWLAGLQRPDGAVPLSNDFDAPAWTTPHALLLWSALEVHEARRRRATHWLLGQRGIPARDPSNIVGHDPSLIGWSWVDGTHSWIEPTAMAVLALRRQGLGGDRRVEDGLRLIYDRLIPSGGWNYGNRSVFGRELRPQAAPTGLALLALAGVSESSKDLEPSLRYLESTLPEIRSARSLAWGLLGLRAWRRAPDASDLWLSEAFVRSRPRPVAVSSLALLLLASGRKSLELLGIA